MEKETVNENINTKSSEEKLLLDIYHNMLYPPPIGKYNKELNLDSSLNMSSLSPILVENKRILLGDGSFSKVHLYLHKISKIKYAVKKINFLQAEKLSNHKNIIENEINIHGRINHPNIIRLHNVFKHYNNYFLILEYASKGTLFDIVRKKKGLTESVAFYYFIQTLNAIYFLHLHSIAHRDLKPENLLINENNILKLCDFGWSVKLNNDKRTTFCGTVEYMAPEIIKKQKYDETIDIWSLGVLLYELVHSYSPFCSEDSDILKIGDNIIQKSLSFKEGLSNEYKDLIKKILIKDSSRRIKIEEIYQHPFMTKYINIIYLQINSKSFSSENIRKENDKMNKNKNKCEKQELNNNNINKNKTLGIIYKKNNKTKNKGCFYKKINYNIKKIVNNSNIINNKKFHDSKNNMNKEKSTRDTDLIFASIPSEPSPKIIPDSKNYKEIKKVSTIFCLNKINNNKIINKNKSILISNSIKNKKNVIQKEDKLKKGIKYDNIISHVKSFSLGQNDMDIKDNKLRIIISINNTQNKNYIKKNKSIKNNSSSTKNKKSMSKYLEDNYIKTCNKKENKKINQTYLFEHKTLLHTNSNNNLTQYNFQDYKNFQINSQRSKEKNIKDNSYINNNYIKTDNNNTSQFISMINSNNYSNIIIHNHSQTKNKNKLTKTPRINNGYSRYLRRIKSDYYKRLNLNNNIQKKSTKGKDIIEKTIKSISSNNNNNFSKSDTNSKSYISNKTIEYNNKNRFNNTINIVKSPTSKTNRNIFYPNFTQNFGINMVGHGYSYNNINNKIKIKNSIIRKNRSAKNKKIIKMPNTKKASNDIIFDINSKKNEINKEFKEKQFSIINSKQKRVRKNKIINKNSF